MLNEPSSSHSTQAHSSTNVAAEAADLMWDAIVNGAALKDIQGVPDSVMEGIYAHAYKFYQQGRAKDAEVFFRFLCLYDMYNSDYVMGLAATFQLQKQYQKALDAYTLAFTLAKNDYRPLLHAGQCYLFMQQPQQARDVFNVLLEEEDVPAPLKAQAQAYIASIKLTETKEETHV